jgi:hypothetical protein
MPGLVPGIHVFAGQARKTWMAGTKPGHDEGHALASPRRVAPELSMYASPKEGVGNAGCLSAPAASCEKNNTRVSHHGRAGFTRHSRTRMVLTVSFALSLVTGLVCHHPRAMQKHCRELTPASGRRDHTTSPSAGCTVRLLRQPASTASRANVRDDRETPLVVGTGRPGLWI